MNQPSTVSVRLRRPLPAQPEMAPPQQPVAVPRTAEALIRALIESVTGRRPLHQVRRCLAPPAFARLLRHAGTGSLRSARVGGVRYQMPTPTAVEAVVRLAAATRWLVCVVRLDRRDIWRCTDFAVLGLDDE